jgi:hypothetical protein
LNPGGGGGSRQVDWSQGSDTPRCPSGTCGGKLCSGYYCTKNPTGVPPDFRDPKDPKGATGPNVGGGGDGGGGGNDDGGGSDSDGGDVSAYNWAARWYDQVSSRTTPQTRREQGLTIFNQGL